MAGLVETEPCQFHLLTLEKFSTLANVVLHFDAEIESNCPEIFVTPFSSAAGRLENVEISGQIRVKTADGARVYLGTVLGYSLGAELSGVSTSLAFWVNDAYFTASSVAPAWEEGVAENVYITDSMLSDFQMVTIPGERIYSTKETIEIRTTGNYFDDSNAFHDTFDWPARQAARFAAFVRFG